MTDTEVEEIVAGLLALADEQERYSKQLRSVALLLHHRHERDRIRQQ